MSSILTRVVHALELASNELMFCAGDPEVVSALGALKADVLAELRQAGGKPAVKLPTPEELQELGDHYGARSGPLSDDELQGLVFTALERWGQYR